MLVFERENKPIDSLVVNERMYEGIIETEGEKEAEKRKKEKQNKQSQEVFTLYWYEFHSGTSSSWCPLVALYSFT